jgi:hypothetical protein
MFRGRGCFYGLKITKIEPTAAPLGKTNELDSPLRRSITAIA